MNAMGSFDSMSEQQQVSNGGVNQKFNNTKSNQGVVQGKQQKIAKTQNNEIYIEQLNSCREDEQQSSQLEERQASVPSKVLLKENSVTKNSKKHERGSVKISQGVFGGRVITLNNKDMQGSPQNESLFQNQQEGNQSQIRLTQNKMSFQIGGTSIPPLDLHLKSNQLHSAMVTQKNQNLLNGSIGRERQSNLVRQIYGQLQPFQQLSKTHDHLFQERPSNQGQTNSTNQDNRGLKGGKRKQQKFQYSNPSNQNSSNTVGDNSKVQNQSNIPNVIKNAQANNQGVQRHKRTQIILQGQSINSQPLVLMDKTDVLNDLEQREDGEKFFENSKSQAVHNELQKQTSFNDQLQDSKGQDLSNFIKSNELFGKQKNSKKTQKEVISVEEMMKLQQTNQIFHQSRALNQTSIVIFRKDNNKRMQTEPVEKSDHIPPLILKPTQVFSHTSNKRPLDLMQAQSTGNHGNGGLSSMQSANVTYSDHMQKQLIARHQMNMTHHVAGFGNPNIDSQGGASLNSFLTVKGTQNNVNTPLASKNFMTYIKSAEDVNLMERKGAQAGVNVNRLIETQPASDTYNLLSSHNINNTNDQQSQNQQRGQEYNKNVNIDMYRQQNNQSTPIGSQQSMSRLIPAQAHIIFDPKGSSSSQLTAQSVKHQKLHPQLHLQQQQIMLNIQASSPQGPQILQSMANAGLQGTQIKSQKPPMSSSSHNSQVGTPSDQQKRGGPPQHLPLNYIESIKEFSSNQQYGGSYGGGSSSNNSKNKNPQSNKRIAISITQVGLTTTQSIAQSSVTAQVVTNNKPKQSVQSVNPVPEQSQPQLQKQSNDLAHRQQRFSNTMVSRGQSLPPDKIGAQTQLLKEEAIFQLPDLNAKSQVQSVQSVQSTPIPRPKKQTIIIPNNTFHYVVGQNQLNSATNQGMQQQQQHSQNYNKFHATQKIHNQGGGPVNQNMYNQSYAARFGLIINPAEAASRKKALLKNNENPLMINMVQNHNQEESDNNYFYGSASIAGTSVVGGQIDEISNPLGFSPMIKRIGESQQYQQHNSGFINAGSPMKLNDDSKLDKYDQIYQNTPQAANSHTQLRNKQLLQDQRDHLLVKQNLNNSESPKKDPHQFTNVKSKNQKENKRGPNLESLANLIDPKQSYLTHDNMGVSERSEEQNPSPATHYLTSQKKRPNEIDSPGVEAFDYSPQNPNGYDSKMSTKYPHFEIHSAYQDPEKNFSQHVQSLYQTTTTQGGDSGIVKAQSGFAVRKGQLIKTQNVQSSQGGQWASAQKQIRLSSEDNNNGLSPNGKSNKKKDGSPFKNKNKFTEKKGHGQHQDQTDLQLEQAFQSILNQRAERLGAVKNYMQVYQKKQPANFLNIQKIGAPNQNANGNRNLQSRGNTENTNRTKQSMLAKIAQGFRQNIVQEKYLDPETPTKFGLTKRLMFKRRQRMKEKNVIIIYFDGVIGDIPYNQGQALGFNNFRVRSGSIKDLSTLCYQSQIVLVMPYTNKRSTVIAKYLQKFASCPFDAVYSVRVKETRSTKKGYLRKWQDYEQIYRDFNLDQPQKILDQCLVIGCYTTELELINERINGGEVDLQNIINVKNPELQGVTCLRARNEVNEILKANPPTLLVPHLDLEIGSLCSFQMILQTLDQMRQTYWNAAQQVHNSSQHPHSKVGNHNANQHDTNPHHKSPPGKNHHLQIPTHGGNGGVNGAGSGHNNQQTQEQLTRSHSHSGIQGTLGALAHHQGANAGHAHGQHQQNEGGSPTHNNHGGSPPSKLMNLPSDQQPRINYSTIFNHISKQMKGSQLEVGLGRAWKLKSLETFDLQRAVLQHEQLSDHLSLKVHWKRLAILNKYRKEDGTMGDPPTYEEIHPECTLYQFGTLMNDNSSLKNKAIEEYRRLYLESGERAAKILGQDIQVPEAELVEYLKDPCKSVPISQVRYDAEIAVDKNSNHRFFLLIPQPQVVQRLQQLGPYLQAFEYIDIIKELADNVPQDMQNLIATNQNSFEIQDWICRKMFTRPQNNGFIGPSGLAKRRGISYMDADFHPTPPPNLPGTTATNFNNQGSMQGASSHNANGGA